MREVLTDGILTRAEVLTVEGAGPFSEHTLRTGPRVWETLVTGGRPDQGAWPSGCVPDLRPAPLAGLENWFTAPAVRAAGAAIGQHLEVAVVAAAERPGASAGRLAALITAAGRIPVALQAPALTDALVRHVLVLALARGVVPVLWSDQPPAGPLPAVDLPIPLVLVVPANGARGDPGPRPGDGATIDVWPRPMLTVDTSPLGREERCRAITAAVPGVGLPTHPIGPATLEPCELAVTAADLQAAAALGGGPLDTRRLIEAVDRRTAAAVPAGAVLVHPVASWADLVLPEDRARQLHEAVARIQAQSTVFDDWGFLRGRAGRAGLRLLLCGPAGTGKTLAAEVVAGELGRDLLVVDLSRMVSKWIGETEKNLAAAFEAAERGGAVLFFDEADALFGKRTEVGDARDRYANLETAYLLSRLERFGGVAILATNLRQNLDAAFSRRIEFIVPFDLPDLAERAELWRRHLPATAPVAHSVDVERLAALYDLPGALIRNAAVAAAFLAAGERGGPGPITVHHVVHAIRREYAKAGQSFPGLPAGMTTTTVHQARAAHPTRVARPSTAGNPVGAPR